MGVVKEETTHRSPQGAGAGDGWCAHGVPRPPRPPRPPAPWWCGGGIRIVRSDVRGGAARPYGAIAWWCTSTRHHCTVRGEERRTDGGNLASDKIFLFCLFFFKIARSFVWLMLLVKKPTRLLVLCIIAPISESSDTLLLFAVSH